MSSNNRIYELSPALNNNAITFDSGTICAIIAGILIALAFAATLAIYVKNYHNAKLRQEQYLAGGGSPLSTPRSPDPMRFEMASEMSPIVGKR